MNLMDGCHSLKLECALRDLGFVDIGWKCVAHAGIFFIQPVGIPDDPDGDLLALHMEPLCEIQVDLHQDHQVYQLVE